jgi:peptidyl-prolyl cis-trans isomerase SDCCAG10
MSTLYNLEPQPTGKVLLKTTLGDIVLELWAKQVPLASRNFIQHCLDGYYDNTIFHRLVPGFIIQGGYVGLLQTFSRLYIDHFIVILLD